MKNDYEVIIIGGGPAGSSAAIYLTDSGFDVCLVEKKKFPRETLCGEFLSIEVINAIKELNIYQQFAALNPNPINSFRFINNDGKQVSAAFYFTAYGLKRGTFDDLLLTTAKNRGTVVFQPSEVKSISKEGEHFLITVKTDQSKDIRLKAKYLMAAYGKQNALDKNFGRVFINSRSRLNGVKFHIPSGFIKDFNKNEIRIYAAEGIYCGVNTVNEDTITFCYLEDRKTLQIPPRDQFVRLSEKNAAFANLFAGDINDILAPLPVYGTGNIYFGKKERRLNDIFMIGDAAGVIAPLAGDGIGMAFESAGLAAEILLKVKTGQITYQTGLQNYESEWDKRFNKRVKTAKLVQKAIMNNFLRKAGVISVQIIPALLKRIILSTRANQN